MKLGELGKDALARELGGVSIEALLEARRRIAGAEPEAPPIGDEPAAGASDWRLRPKLSLPSLLAQAASGEWRAGGERMDAVAEEAAPSGQKSLAAPGEAAHRAANQLKSMLAVRDWADPRALLPPGLDEETAGLALAIVAGEVRTEVRPRPGRWYHEVSARRRILGTRDLDELRACAAPRGADDQADPIRRAFEQLLREPPVEPDSTDLDVLRAMHCAADWIGRRIEVDRDRIAARLEKRMRQADVERILETPMIGRDIQRERLRDFVARPRSGQPLAVLEIYGVGGSGKSTLLAHVEAALRDAPDAPVLVHLDFDREFLDVDDPYSLDLALLDAIAGARPDKASASLALARELAHLRQAEREDRKSLLGRRDRRLGAAVRKRQFGFAEQEALESVAETEDSRRLSLLWGRLGPNSDIGKDLRLALVLDTLEHVVGRGASATHALARWLISLSEELGADGACVILSGRDPPPPEWNLHLPSLLQTRGHLIDQPAIELGELEMDDAVALLMKNGVASHDTATAAAAALPRVPLLLRICADVLTEKGVAEEVRSAHAEGRVDPETSRRYLTSRIVRHVADPVARDYVLAAFALPEVTETLLRELVVPIVDAAARRETARGRARRVYQALLDSTWLTTRAPDLQSFTFLPAIRSIALKLIASDPAETRQAGEIRRAAIAYHDRRRSPKDEAFALYHRLMLGQSPGRIADPEGKAAILARFLDDLAAEGRELLLQGGPAGAMPTHADSDDEWRAYLEGVGSIRGQGPALVQRGETQAALRLYEGRPTRADGVPPDFVIQALAYGGGWDDPVVDVAAVIDEIGERSRLTEGRWRVPGTLRSRLYWITRLALLRRPARLEPLHEALLAGAATDIKAVQGEAALPAIIAVAEAFSGARIGMPSWLKARGAMGRVVRYALVQSLVHGNPVRWQAPMETLAVVQQDWISRVRDIGGLRLPIEAARAAEILGKLSGLPLHKVSQQLRALRQPARVEIGDLQPAEQIVLLRGKTTEFLRPLAAALSAPTAADGSTAAVVADALQETVTGMSILPEFPMPDQMAKRTDASKERSWRGLIDLFDLARVLPGFCARLDAADPGGDIGRIARTFLAWDAALTRNGSSEWRQERAGRAEPRDPARAPAGAGDRPDKGNASQKA